jgi:hypothetical protein
MILSYGVVSAVISFVFAIYVGLIAACVAIVVFGYFELKK